MNLARKISQLFFDFQEPPTWKPADGPIFDPTLPKEKKPKSAKSAKELEPDEALTQTCRELLLQIGLSGMAKVVQVNWNPRLRSTAGYASYPAWRIELNPRLREFDGQVQRTLRHELAHLVAYHRVGRRKIEPHGVEWRQACADLGIPDESVRHTLPLPRREVKRRYTYACAYCETKIQRVRKFRRLSACIECCNKHNGGKYDHRFRFVLVEKPEP